MRHVLVVLAVVLAIASSPLSAAPSRAAEPAGPRKPNVLFILTDDLGYGDVGAFFQNARRVAKAGPAHATPNLDALAAAGVKLTRHYCPAPVCAPSRASLLLGVHQGHANVRDNQFDKALEDNHTVASVLREAGYHTGAIGKWGLQGANKAAKGPADWPAYPLNRGFDDYYGYVRHADGHEHYPKEGVYRGKKEVWDGRTEVSAGLDKCYTTDLFAARAKRWVVEHERATPGKPFFLYLAFDTPHATLELPTGPYPAGAGLKGGLQWLGKPGEMINTATGTPDSFVHPDYASTDWPDVYKRYATSVRRIDDAVGDLMATLADLGIDRDTIVVFTSDNGPSIESYLPEQYKPTFFGSFGPFDGIKRDCWDGGLRVPTIVRWPGHVPAGREAAVASSFADWMPTLAEAAGVPAPARSDGVSLLPAFTGKGEQRPPRVYVEYFQNQKTPPFAQPNHRGRQRNQMQAIVVGDRVGVRYDIKGADDDFEIYDLADAKQVHNLAGKPGMDAVQAELKATALRSRRPDPDAKRPYDAAPMPAVESKADPKADPKPGVAWRAYAGAFPWVPQFEAMTPVATGVAGTIGTNVGGRSGDGGVFFAGFLTVPADGAYELSLATNGRAILRVHEATVIDADHGTRVGGKDPAGTVVLKAGRHPFRLYHVPPAAGTIPTLSLFWSGPGIERHPVPAAALSQ